MTLNNILELQKIWAALFKFQLIILKINLNQAFQKVGTLYMQIHIYINIVVFYFRRFFDNKKHFPIHRS